MDLRFHAEDASTLLKTELEDLTPIEPSDFGKLHLPYDTLEIIELSSDEYNVKEYATYIMNNRTTSTPKDFTFEAIFCSPGELIAALDGNVN